MKKQALEKSVQEALTAGKKRNFIQTVELIVNLRDLKTNKPDGQIDLKVKLPHATGKESGKTLLFSHTEAFSKKAAEHFDTVIKSSELQGMSKSKINEISQHDVLLAEGPAMLEVAKHLGQELAPRGKMPKPVTGSADGVSDLLKKMSSTTRVTNKKGKGIPLLQVVVGREDMGEGPIAENIQTVMEDVIKALPKQKQNVKSVLLKKTMAAPVKLEL